MQKHKVVLIPSGNISADLLPQTSETIALMVYEQLTKIGVLTDEVAFLTLRPSGYQKNLPDFSLDLHLSSNFSSFEEYLAELTRMYKFCAKLQEMLEEAEYVHGTYKKPTKFSFMVSPIVMYSMSKIKVG